MLHLIIVLQAPMMSFGTTRIDQVGPTGIFPTLSMITGLLGNALGYDRSQHQELQDLQERLVYAARLDGANERRLTDYQTAQMRQGERAWTPTGEPEERAGGTYRNHQMRREYLQDARVTAALRLDPPGRSPDLQDLMKALHKPERPIFIGRKNCIPSTRLLAGTQEARTCLEALVAWPAEPGWDRREEMPATWPLGEGMQGVTASTQRAAQDIRAWKQGVAAGERTIMEGTITPARAPQEEEE